MNSFPYKTALITGASSGIGKAFAYELAQKGVTLILTARSKNKLAEISSDLKLKFGVEVSYIVSDLSRIESAKEIHDEIANQRLSVDLLVNNAGIGQWANFMDQPMDVYQATINLNISSLVSLTHHFIPDMLNKGKGGVINVASGAAFQPGPYMTVYAASKAFVLSFSESLYGEYMKRGITVTAICPGNTTTDFQATANANVDGMPASSPEEVAIQGLAALCKNKATKVIGTSNYLLSLLPSLLPRRLIISIVKNMMYKRINAADTHESEKPVL